jgi:rhodanese-related sulfurtransferase
MINAPLVVNVLPAERYEIVHIEGSVNISLDQLQKVATDWDHNKEIVVYCAGADCPMSVKAWLILDRMGFKRVYAYEGGIQEWQRKGYPVAGTSV